jgi:hypothetical protein
MKNCNTGGFTGPVTLGECVQQAVAEVDNTPNVYYINLVQDELEDLLETHDKLIQECVGGTGGWAIKKAKELLKEKIEIINGAM